MSNNIFIVCSIVWIFQHIYWVSLSALE